MNSLTRYILTIFLLIVLLLPARLVRAHGGFVIDSGASDTYEWVVSIFPYPVPVGATVISILLFEKTMGIPAMDMGVLLDDLDLYPDEQLSEIATKLGFGPRFDELVGLKS